MQTIRISSNSDADIEGCPERGGLRCYCLPVLCFRFRKTTSLSALWKPKCRTKVPSLAGCTRRAVHVATGARLLLAFACFLFALISHSHSLGDAVTSYSRKLVPLTPRQANRVTCVAAFFFLLLFLLLLCEERGVHGLQTIASLPYSYSSYHLPHKKRCILQEERIVVLCFSGDAQAAWHNLHF